MLRLHERSFYFDEVKLPACHACGQGFGVDKSFSGSGQKFFREVKELRFNSESLPLGKTGNYSIQ